MRQELQELKVEIYQDGSVDADEVKTLRTVLRLYGLGEQEARLLLDINNVLSRHDRHTDFDALLVESITDYVLDDDKVLSQDKLNWLKENVFKDDRIDQNEKNIIAQIDKTAKTMPPGFGDLLRA
ncbi:MAG: hypothetical protein COB59_06615 [Rhodospirillaceae bacterium]|nr:MAG: hypothetical protein COB59_06615 [Rhodospirillaceae bacterium]